MLSRVVAAVRVILADAALPRREQMVVLHQLGLTLREIGAVHGIKGERVRQILHRPPPPAFDGVPVSTRLRNAPHNEGCKTWADVTARSREEWLRVPNCGRATVAELECVLASMGERTPP